MRLSYLLIAGFLLCLAALQPSTNTALKQCSARHNLTTCQLMAWGR